MLSLSADCQMMDARTLSDAAARLSYQYLTDPGGGMRGGRAGGLGPIAILGTHHQGGLQRICSANSCQQIPDSRHHTTAASTRFLLVHTPCIHSLRSPSAAPRPTTDRRLPPGPRLEQRWCVIDFSCHIPHANHPCFRRRVKPSRYRVRIHVVRARVKTLTGWMFIVVRSHGQGDGPGRK